ncbi:MAG: tetratricopeptide repeat protein [Haloechinothrix sp.]
MNSVDQPGGGDGPRHAADDVRSATQWAPPPVEPTLSARLDAEPEPSPEPSPQVPADTGAQMTSVLVMETPETRSIQPPAPKQEPTQLALPDPGTESLMSGPGTGEPDTPTGSRPGTSQGTSGTGSGAFPGTARRTGSRSSRTSRRGGLGAGLVEVPQVPYREPSSAVLENPVVAENKRFCSHCTSKVGRSTDDRPGSPEGTCAKCGAPFSFTPKLRPGEVVGGQYEVLGALAYGGLGWIYLAQDHNVNDRWVVLKGLIDTGDETAMDAAVNETRYLAEVEHPNIVKIYNFVEHPDPKTGTTVGYIVMEYVGGQSLRQLALAHHKQAGRPESLPIGQVVAYGLEILPALGYLHSQGLLYCDLKPDNVIQTNEQLKLIDMGAVRRLDDYASPLFFTTGYSAPELGTHGASVQSDLFTVGRTLAVLSFEFAGYTTKYKTTLPTVGEVPLFALFGSYHRFLRRSTHADPDRRFLSAADMADQLTGVLREIMALGTGKQRPGTSTVFGAETRSFGVDAVVGDGDAAPMPDPLEVVTGLPVPLVDTDDAAASLLASTTAADPREVIEILARAPHDSIEVRLRVVRARIELGEPAEANRQLQAAQYLAVKSGFPHAWRIDWYRGLIELAGGRPKLAHAAFDAVHDELPGEIAPKLGMAVSAEVLGDYFSASRFYELVWRTDRSYVSAAFGLARVYLAQGGRGSAMQTLESIPETSTHYVAAQVAAIKIKTRESAGAGKHVVRIGEHDLVDAAERLERLALDAERRTRLSAEVLEAAYGWVRERDNGRPPSAGPAQGSGHRVLGCDLSERELRFGLERCYRALARLAGSPEQRIALVDKANAIRPRTLT